MKCATMFPSDVIHIGGDEVPKVRWAQCPKCQAKMKRLGLENEAALQTAFINEMGAHVAKRGKRIMGWDEILEGGLPEGAIVQSWRGMEGAVEATHLGTDAVVSPTSHCYLDYPLRSTDLKEVYAISTGARRSVESARPNPRWRMQHVDGTRTSRTGHGQGLASRHGIGRGALVRPGK